VPVCYDDLVRARRPLVSEEEFLQLPESSTKIELIDGEVIVSPAPSPQHQEVVRRLIRAVETWIGSLQEQERPTMLFAPVDVRFRRGRILQPDVAIWCRAFDLPEKVLSISSRTSAPRSSPAIAFMTA
jgi:Uma2 family endonuclease